MCHVIHMVKATSAGSSPRPWERPETAWRNISHTGGKRPYYKDEDIEQRAGALENLGLYYIRTRQWQKAFEYTNEILKLSRRTAWNWAVRAIAAHHLGRRVEENEACEEWSKTPKKKNINDLHSLRFYICAETDLLPPEDTGGDTR
jgi:tetratricopeptide (TPR) repeat protein